MWGARRSAAWAAGVAAAAVLWASPGVAAGETVVSGAAPGSVAPLVIAPSDDPVVERLDLAGAPADVVFIQRMPATKVVTTVTVGNFAKDPTCQQAAPLRLYVREAPTGDLWDDHSQIAYSPQMVAPPEQPGRMTFQIPATTLRAGRGYIFRLGWEGGCRFVSQTTWAHNAPTVNPGPSACTGPPQMAGGVWGGPSYRMWHQQGVDDRNPACLNDPTNPVYSPLMPTGWMVTQGVLAWSITAKAGERQIGDPLCKDDNFFNMGVRDAGVIEAPWAWFDPRANFLCQWTSYAGPPGAQVADGWYYGLPWTRQRLGAPRDAYLKLERTDIDYGYTLEQYKPLLKFDTQETQFPLSPAAATDLFSGTAPDSSNSLHAGGSGVLALSNPALVPALAPARLTLGLLGPAYEYGGAVLGQAGADDYLDERGPDPAADGEDLYFLPSYSDRIHARAVQDSGGGVWLQYWVFYYYNLGRLLGAGDHEGDWEFVQIGLSATGAPEVATYAQHDGATRCPWAQVERNPGTPNPVVYVELGAHASHFRSSLASGHGGWDGNGPHPPLALESSGDPAPGWTRWPGRWGADGGLLGSPTAPMNHSQWSDPAGFNAQALTDCEQPP